MHGVNAELIPPLVPDFNYRIYIYFANKKRTRFSQIFYSTFQSLKKVLCMQQTILVYF